jgi:valyl-tRNA synthetase
VNLPPKQENQFSIAIGPVEVYIPFEGLVDTGEERDRLNQALIDAKSQVDRLEKLLASSFTERAPEAIVQKEKDKLNNYQTTVENLEKQLSALD